MQIRGLVRLACFESLVALFVVLALKPLLSAHAGLDVEILYATAPVDLRRHHADLALRLSRPEHGNLRMRHLAVMGFGLYGPANGEHPRRHVTWPEDVSVAASRASSASFGAMASPG